MFWNKLNISLKRYLCQLLTTVLNLKVNTKTLNIYFIGYLTRFTKEKHFVLHCVLQITREKLGWSKKWVGLTDNHVIVFVCIWVGL